jgi:hypothetical protein
MESLSPRILGPLLAALLAAPCAFADGSGLRFVDPDGNREYAIEPDLDVLMGYGWLYLESSTARAAVPLPYGSNRGFPDEIWQASVSPRGLVTLVYASNWREGPLVHQTFTLDTLRAKLLMAAAEQRQGSSAEQLAERAGRLDPSEPRAAVARASLAALEPSRAEALLAPAFATDRLQTYFEVLRRGQGLRELPLVKQQRARVPGTARLDQRAPLHATAGSLLALSISPESEADCTMSSELFLLDVRTGLVVFRAPYMQADHDCHESFEHVSELNQLLRDLGFRQQGEQANAEWPALMAEWPEMGRCELSFKRAGVTLSIRERAELRRGRRSLGSVAYDGDVPRVAYLLPALGVIVVASNRNSDVAEGFPTLSVLPLPASQSGSG